MDFYPLLSKPTKSISVLYRYRSNGSGRTYGEKLAVMLDQ